MYNLGLKSANMHIKDIHLVPNIEQTKSAPHSPVQPQ